MSSKYSHQLRFRNPRQVILWNEEMAGQISDGQWENSGPQDHWIPWHECEVMCDPVTPGRTFYAKKDGYLLTSQDLLSIVGNRMLEEVQKDFPGYTWDEMIKDLRDMRKIMKLTVTPLEGDELEAARAAAVRHPVITTPAVAEGVKSVPVVCENTMTTVTGYNAAENKIVDYEAEKDLATWINELSGQGHPCHCQSTPHGMHAVLPTGKRIDLNDPTAAEYYDSGQTAYYLVPDEGAKAPCVVTTFGAHGYSWMVGTSHTLKHDQTGKFWGTYHVAYVVRFADGAHGGTVPTGKFRHLVFK